MSLQFDGLWRELIALSVEHLPWNAMVDFRAHVSPRMRAGQPPDVPYSAEASRMSEETYTSFTARLAGREIELRYFPGSELWKCCGRVQDGLDTHLVVEFSPRDRVLARGPEKLQELALEAFTWLKTFSRQQPELDGELAGKQAVSAADVRRQCDGVTIIDF